MDEKTGQQIAYDNVILQYCNGEVRDKNDYLAFGCHGDIGAPVQVFTQGKAINGTWTRHADGDPAVYVDQNGQRIKLTPGKTWICLGKAINGTWTRHADGDPAVYVDQNGQRLKLTPGKTWICLVWNDYAGDVVLK